MTPPNPATPPNGPENPEVPAARKAPATPDTHSSRDVPGTPDVPDDADDGMEQQNPPDPRNDAPRPDASDDDAALFGETPDEAALRALMHGAVRDLHGAPDALEHLRRAIPLRRQRRKQAALGAVAAVLLIGMAVPAVVHAAGNSGRPHAAPAGLASSQYSSPGADGNTRTWGDPGPSGEPSAPQGGASKPPSSGGIKNLPTGPTGTGAPVPDCSSAQLGQGDSQAGSPDSGGRVHGWFRVANVSATACTVPSSGIVQAVAQGAADQAQIQVVENAGGDPGLQLPSSGTNGPVVLSPGQDYEIAFAWVPSSAGTGGCPTPTTPPVTPTPTDTATDPDGTDSGTDSSGSSGESAQQQAPSASMPPGSIVLNHTPAAGAPVVDGPVIEGACAGTVYTSTAIPAPTGTSTS